MLRITAYECVGKGGESVTLKEFLWRFGLVKGCPICGSKLIPMYDNYYRCDICGWGINSRRKEVKA